jgi:hypothetical protein
MVAILVSGRMVMFKLVMMCAAMMLFAASAFAMASTLRRTIKLQFIMDVVLVFGVA